MDLDTGYQNSQAKESKTYLHIKKKSELFLCVHILIYVDLNVYFRIYIKIYTLS